MRSQPVRTMTWEYQPPDPCADADGADPDQSMFTYKRGFLPAGSDLPDIAKGERLTEAQAEKRCLADSRCAGFTFSASTRGDKAGTKHDVHFKSKADGVSDAPGWHTLRKRKRGADCRPGFRKPPPPPLRLRVDVLRESPPVYIVHDFATERECQYMMDETIPHMAPSVVSGGTTSRHRQSFSVNMYPDYEDESNVITRMVRRKFAFAREVAEYDELIEGAGQEPLNSVYYKNWDDQYRPHCDGQCYGGAYRKGERIATSLTYCSVADKGGYTMFTRSGSRWSRSRARCSSSAISCRRRLRASRLRWTMDSRSIRAARCAKGGSGSRRCERTAPAACSPLSLALPCPPERQRASIPDLP